MICGWAVADETLGTFLWSSAEGIGEGGIFLSQTCKVVFVRSQGLPVQERRFLDAHFNRKFFLWGPRKAS